MLFIIIRILIIAVSSAATASFQPPSFRVVGRRVRQLPLLRGTTVASYAGDPNAGDPNADLKTRVALIEERENTTTATLLRIETIVTALDKKFDAKFEKIDAKFEKIDGKFETLDNKIDGKFETLDNKIDAKFETLDNKIDAKFETLDNKIDAKFETSDNKIDAVDKKFDGKFETLDKKIDALDKKFDGKFTVLYVFLAVFTTATGMQNLKDFVFFK